ncbi:carbon-nitrogen hydrolase family protein [Halomonas ramblicola]|uniref:carbon-nitrogen hydrolase family protein n=1 Tax=Halomonas ramblicola TaxID=747349 RepID=UPI0025B283B6|nr:carbon-nitrogen hydrolase family protein [Halomonas ramblicola]MDN3522158.1 carbon-nitrogen hydrolase family protein [Halomonas ramblicola]
MTSACHRVTVATAQYPIDRLRRFDDFVDKANRWVADAAGRGAELLVFPEYGGMELTSLLPEAVLGDLSAQLEALQPLRDDYLATWTGLARRHAVTLLTPSLPWRVDDDRYVNRAWLITPDGRAAHQDKQIMTRFENDDWGVGPGDGLRLFDTPAGRLGVLICYDCEFPDLARTLVEAGADLLLVPSCTDTLAGYHRVRLSAQARAIEQQVAVVHSPTVGEAPWSPAVDINTGHAAVYTPCDHGFPPDGILIRGDDAPGWQLATLDLPLIRALRERGQVNNFHDWPHQHSRLAQGLQHLDLAADSRGY